MISIFDNLISIFEYLNASEDKDAVELKLRHFEYELISELGYGFNIKEDVEGNIIEKNLSYSFNPQLGFFERREKE
jgi:recombinational DNA repair protein (RecF pathway)